MGKNEFHFPFFIAGIETKTDTTLHSHLLLLLKDYASANSSFNAILKERYCQRPWQNSRN